MKEKEGRKEKERKKESNLESLRYVCVESEKTRAPRGHTDAEERSIQMVPLTVTVSYLDGPGKELYK